MNQYPSAARILAPTRTTLCALVWAFPGCAIIEVTVSPVQIGFEEKQIWLCPQSCHRNKCLFLTALPVLYFFFTFPFYTTFTVIQDWRKKQLQWGTALKHSYFVPFFLMQTFHGLSTWITFWWCSRTIFARTYLIAVLSTLCNVHSLYLHYICISYMLPKRRRFYIQ